MFQYNGLYHSDKQRLVFSRFVFDAVDIYLSFVWIGPRVHFRLSTNHFMLPIP